MLIRIPRGWEIPETLVTPEHMVLNRRHFLAGAGAVAATGALTGGARAAEENDPTADLYPAKLNPKYTISRPVTDEKINSTYNNFYEFGFSKRISRAARALPIRPWELRIDGEVEKPFTIAIDDLIRRMTLEERLYRHRCVEAWSMTIAWSGFAMRDLVSLAKPLSGAKYVRMETFHNSNVAPGQRTKSYPWPYVEGLTIAEATNELAFLATGAYGKPLAKQFGAPLRLAVPWKYGFKSIKSIVRVSFTSERPKSFWEKAQGAEYGFWANVNPEVDHPRWSQADEEVLGAFTRIPTKLFNGYGEYVADMYKDLKHEPLFM
ncbi:MAG: protein-methionine-sulfoxide reductase catalytic subunit MsrP [Pseudomonadota bacterium]|nr:protein-methionine-sulfoxide reductase catalytic subunit MsrP [Pseudomonadota bacterium]